MDFATLKAQLEQARQIEAAIEGATFQLRLPSDHAWTVAMQLHMDGDGHVQEARACREVLDSALTGWRDVTVAHFRMEGDAPVEFSPAARGELLNERQDIADQLIVAIAKARGTRKQRFEAARKN